jgi:hypothetical protein
MNGIPIPDIDENPWAEGPAIEPRPTNLGPLLPPLPVKPQEAKTRDCRYGSTRVVMGTVIWSEI